MQLSNRDKWIFLFLVTLCVIILIGVPIVTHSIQNVWYGLVAVLFIIGIYNIFHGTKKLHITRQNGQTTIWYKDYMIDIGIMGLLLGFFELVTYGINDYLSASIGVNMTYGLIGLLGVGALFFFVLSLKYRSNRSSASQASR